MLKWQLLAITTPLFVNVFRSLRTMESRW